MVHASLNNYAPGPELLMRIDVHHHLFPPAYIARLVAADHYLARGVARQWTPQVSIEDMDAAGVRTALPSIPAPSFAVFRSAVRFELYRECNGVRGTMA